MDSKEIFRAFLRANGLKLMAVIEPGGPWYENEDQSIKVSRKVLMESAGYAGFVDGIQGMPSKRAGPVGTAESVETDEEPSIDERVRSLMEQFREDPDDEQFQSIPCEYRDDSEVLAEYFRLTLVGHQEILCNYVGQYQKGAAASGGGEL